VWSFRASPVISFLLFSFFFPPPSNYSFLTPLSFILQSGLFSFSRLILVIRQTMSGQGPPRPLRPFVPRTLQDTPTAGPIAEESKIRRASTACIECQRCRTKVPFPFEARASFGISWCYCMARQFEPTKIVVVASAAVRSSPSFYNTPF
jgi:hypothetical protein